MRATDPLPQRLVFGDVADAYDEFRPGYPPALYDLLLADAPRDVLDIGCGTGKVAAALLDREVRSGTGIEPDPTMAAVAERRLGAGRWTIHVGDFETCPLPDDVRCDLITCGQAWHWIDTDAGLERARGLLRPGGRLALFWNRPVWADSELRAALDDVYERLVPAMTSSLASRSRGHKGQAPPTDPPPDGFDDARNHEFHHDVTYSSASWIGLLGTHSNHVMLDPATRRSLLAGVRRTIDERGGTIRIDYRTDCWTATRA